MENSRQSPPNPPELFPHPPLPPPFPDPASLPYPHHPPLCYPPQHPRHFSSASSSSLEDFASAELTQDLLLLTPPGSCGTPEPQLLDDLARRWTLTPPPPPPQQQQQQQQHPLQLLQQQVQRHLRDAQEKKRDGTGNLKFDLL